MSLYYHSIAIKTLLLNNPFLFHLYKHNTGFGSSILSSTHGLVSVSQTQSRSVGYDQGSGGVCDRCMLFLSQYCMFPTLKMNVSVHV